MSIFYCRFAFFLSILFVTLDRSQCQLTGFTDRFTSGARLGIEKTFDIAKSVNDFIPNPLVLADYGKQAFLGLPFSAALDGLNQFCSLALKSNGGLKRDEKVIPDKTKLKLKLFDDITNKSFPMDRTDDLFNYDTFKKEAPTVLLVTGWLSSDINETNTAADTIYRAYRCRGDTNFILADTAKFINTIYAWSALNTEDLGRHLAVALSELSKKIPVENLHIIGHSLGAHISGAIGRHFFELTNKSLPRITGLDPARPCFNEGEALSGLGRGDATFVDIIHSDSDGLGKKTPIGDVDFYPNGAKILMPGCYDLSCAHGRAWQYYAESVYPGHEETFMGSKCNSLASFNAGLCRYKPIPMGFAAPNTAKGNYFLQTNSDAPFGTKKFNNECF